MTEEQRDSLNVKFKDVEITPQDNIELIAYVLEGGIADWERPVRVSISIDDIKVLAEAMKEGVL